jgi:acetyl esterase/lipase
VTMLDTQVRVGEPVALWPGIAPGSKSWTHEETTETDPATDTLLIKGVVVPTLTPVHPPEELRNGTAVVIAPGGAFVALAWEHEGMATARWFAERGVTAFVLKYRLARPPSPGDEARLMADAPSFTDQKAWVAFFESLVTDAAELGVADGEQAVRLVRSRSQEWGLDQGRVGVLGFSAGGTVALRSAATTDPEARPAFVVDVYGAFFRAAVPDDAPPCFTVVAADDFALDWCLDAARQWRDAGCPIELHVYERGGHGFGLRTQGAPIDAWTDRLADWLNSRGLL